MSLPKDPKANDFLKENKAINEAQETLRNKIEHRLLFLAKNNPEAIICFNSFKAKDIINKDSVKLLTNVQIILYIDHIEKWLNDKQSHKQLEIFN